VVSPTGAPGTFELDGEVYDLFDLGAGRIKWERTPQAGQPGDSKQVKAAPIEMHAGFGASRRIRRSGGASSDPAHHNYAENVSAQYEGLVHPAPRITYLDMSSTGATRRRGFRIGGYANSRIGGNGSGIGAIGGGQFSDSPWYIREFNGQLYVHCGKYTFTVNPDLTVPAASEVRVHGAGARARWSDVFGSKLGVALGRSANADWLLGSTSGASEVTGTPQTFTYMNTGAEQTLVVPEGVTEVTVDAQGSQGGGALGGDGARTQTTLTVTPGETLRFYVGGQNGYNGGGAAGASSSGYSGNVGGGATDIRQGGALVANRVVVAGGGGGMAGFAAGAGGDAGQVGQDAADGSFVTGGNGATQSAVGTGGSGAGGTAGAAGSAEAGGAGGFNGGEPGGGGGGGGYFGGGGGGPGTSVFNDPSTDTYPGAGGGGGSSYANPSVTDDTTYTTGYRSGDGQLIISFTPVLSAAAASGGPGWETAEIAVDVYRAGTAGRLFAGAGERVYNVLPDSSPLLAANYLPSAGEVITEESDPIRGIVEYSAALVAGTARTARTLDPSRGFQGVSLLPESRLSASEHDGRSMIAIGPILFHATTQAVYLFAPGRSPVTAGPEELAQNESPYVGPEWGVPDFMGKWLAWPAYFPQTGDSVIFFARMREQGEVGTGPIAWHDVLHLEGREARSVRYWGGTATRKPRLFFGAGTTANPFQVGWCDLGRGGAPDPFTSDGQPATSGFIETPLDDLGLPGVTKAVERVEIPNLRRADSDNYLTVQAKADAGSWTNLVKAQTGTNQERVTSAGFARVMSQVANIISGKEIAVRFNFVQAIVAIASNWLLMHGTPMLYYTEVPDTVDVIETLVDAKTADYKAADTYAASLAALMSGPYVSQKHGPDGVERYVHVIGASVTTVENNGTKPDNRLAIALTMREVLV